MAGSKANWNIDLRDPELFGNEMAEDEEQHVFESYAFLREEFSTFLEPTRKLQIVRAYKGEGKSALLRLTDIRLRTFKNVVCFSCYANAIAPDCMGKPEAECVRLWKDAFIRIAARAVGAKLDFSFADDVLSLREEAEKGGYKERGFVSAVLSRLKKLPLEPCAAGAADPASSLKRIAGGNDIQIWLSIDDVDENFKDVEIDNIRVMAAFVAMRQLTNEIRELRFRSSVRPSTWAILKPRYEALSKIEPYMLDLKWSESQLEQMLGNRVRSYLSRNSGPAVASGTLSGLDARHLVAVALEDPMIWGQGKRAPSVVLSSLGRYRPRWIIELCKLAADRATKDLRSKIGLDDLVKRLEDFGVMRIQDLVAEFRAQCEKVHTVIESFKGRPEQFKTDELIKHLKAHLSNVDIRIAGIAGKPSEMEILRFLFQIGFITARGDLDGGDYRHYSFFDEPHLLRDGASDQGVSWEIPSCFRQALQLKNVQRKMPR